MLGAVLHNRVSGSPWVKVSLKIGLYAVPFGYGPVSKAKSIASSVEKLLDVEWYWQGPQL